MPSSPAGRIICRRADDFARRVRAAPVSLDARQMARLGPAPVAVHDHRDVAREIGGSFGAQMWNGETHFACPQITRIALISKMKNIVKLHSTDNRPKRNWLASNQNSQSVLISKN